MLALYSAALRPLPAGGPAGPALHNRYVMQTAACQNSTPAPLKRRTPYTIPKACSRVLSSQPGFRQLRRLAPVCLPESPSGFPQVAAMPRLTTPCHLMSSKLTRLCLVSSRHEPWTLNAGFAFPSTQATGNSPALPARRPQGGSQKQKQLHSIRH